MLVFYSTLGLMLISFTYVIEALDILINEVIFENYKCKKFYFIVAGKVDLIN